MCYFGGFPEALTALSHPHCQEAAVAPGRVLTRGAGTAATSLLPSWWALGFCSGGQGWGAASAQEPTGGQ